jgi:hypothetical protein
MEKNRADGQETLLDDTVGDQPESFIAVVIGGRMVCPYYWAVERFGKRDGSRRWRIQFQHFRQKR